MGRTQERTKIPSVTFETWLSPPNKFQDFLEYHKARQSLVGKDYDAMKDSYLNLDEKIRYGANLWLVSHKNILCSSFFCLAFLNCKDDLIRWGWSTFDAHLSTIVCWSLTLRYSVLFWNAQETNSSCSPSRLCSTRLCHDRSSLSEVGEQSDVELGSAAPRDKPLFIRNEWMSKCRLLRPFSSFLIITGVVTVVSDVDQWEYFFTRLKFR